MVVANGCDCNFVKRSCGLFSVTCNKGDSAAFIKKVECTGNLSCIELKVGSYKICIDFESGHVFISRIMSVNKSDGRMKERK